MSNLVVQVGSQTNQGIRGKNEDRFVVDMDNQVFVVADGMGGQEHGDQASELAVDLIPRIIQERLSAQDDGEAAIQKAMNDANLAIVEAGMDQPEGRRMGTTAVLALHSEKRIIIGNLGDSRAYLIRGEEVSLLTQDHSVANALVITGALSPDEARLSPYQHVLHKYLGCAGMHDGPDLHSFEPQPGDRLLLATDGLTNYISDEDLREGAKDFPNVQVWADHLVEMALERGTTDNVTCIVLAFEAQ